MRSRKYEIPPQEVKFGAGQLPQMTLLLQILTKDSVTVFVNAIMYYKVANAIHAVANVDDYSGSARLLAATTLRNVLGTMNLGEILSQRESIAREMRVGNSAEDMRVMVVNRRHLMLPQNPGELRLRELRLRM